MDIRTITPALYAISESGLHPALGSRGMRTPGRNQAQGDHPESGLGRFNGRPFPGQPGPDAQ
jgi:hypothetical protein